MSDEKCTGPFSDANDCPMHDPSKRAAPPPLPDDSRALLAAPNVDAVHAAAEALMEAMPRCTDDSDGPCCGIATFARNDDEPPTVCDLHRACEDDEAPYAGAIRSLASALYASAAPVPGDTIESLAREWEETWTRNGTTGNARAWIQALIDPDPVGDRPSGWEWLLSQDRHEAMDLRRRTVAFIDRERAARGKPGT